MFFYMIFDLIFDSNDERIIVKSYEALWNLTQDDETRRKLTNEGYYKRIYESVNVYEWNETVLDKISWLTTLICFYPDMIDEIIELNLLEIILELCKSSFQSKIRANAVLALSLLTYHEKWFEELIKKSIIDLVMNLCQDSDIDVKQFATLALVHFALNRQSISILIQKGVMDLFNSFASINNVTIQTNVSWIFLALCNNGITGKTMLENGITRDMFLVSCNPQYNQIRHLVIAGFAELGRCTDVASSYDKWYSKEVQKVKEKSIVGMHMNFKDYPEKTINILLRFAVSKYENYRIIAYWALKDYILLNYENQLWDLEGIIEAFVIGTISENLEILEECANSISFLITHRLVYKSSHSNAKSRGIIDSLMILTKSDSKFIRTRAFSTLSTLSTYASANQDVLERISEDMKMGKGQSSREYLSFITQRLEDQRKIYTEKYYKEDIEEKYSGLFSLVSIAKEPSNSLFSTISERLKSLVCSAEFDQLNEIYFLNVFSALQNSTVESVLQDLIKTVQAYIKPNEKFNTFEVINANSVLWLLKIIVKFRNK